MKKVLGWLVALVILALSVVEVRAHDYEQVTEATSPVWWNRTSETHTQYFLDDLAGICTWPHVVCDDGNNMHNSNPNAYRLVKCQCQTDHYPMSPVWPTGATVAAGHCQCVGTPDCPVGTTYDSLTAECRFNECQSESPGHMGPPGIAPGSMACVSGCVFYAGYTTLDYTWWRMTDSSCDGSYEDDVNPAFGDGVGPGSDGNDPPPPDCITDASGAEFCPPPNGLNCGTVNGEQVCVESLGPNTCVSAGEGVFCVAGPGGTHGPPPSYDPPYNSTTGAQLTTGPDLTFEFVQPPVDVTAPPPPPSSGGVFPPPTQVVDPCVANPSLPECSAPPPEVDPCIANPSLPECANPDLCNTYPDLPGCSHADPCEVNPGLPECVDPDICLQYPSLPGCQEGGAPDPCLADPTLPGCYQEEGGGGEDPCLDDPTLPICQGGGNPDPCLADPTLEECQTEETGGGDPTVGKWPKFDEVQSFQVSTQMFLDTVTTNGIIGAANNLSFSDAAGTCPISPISTDIVGTLDLAIICDIWEMVRGTLELAALAAWAFLGVVIVLRA